MCKSHSVDRSRRTAAALTVVMMAGHAAATSVSAQEPVRCTDPSINNLQHPVGTMTATLGALGHVEKRGNGPVPMILIPGAAFGWSVWESFMDRNVDVYTMYAITPAGYDGTRPPPMPKNTDYTKRPWTDALCQAVVDLIEREELDRPLVVGHHMLGDYYAMRIAIERAADVRGVVIIAGSPSYAFAGPGNQPGKPIVFASQPQREMLVEQMSVPFYRTVTPEMWRAGSYQAEQFCRDPQTAETLFKAQVGVPVPTQVRYFLEYMTADLSKSFVKLDIPVLIVQPEVKWTLDLALKRWKKSNEMMYGSLSAAKQQFSAMLTQFWGDVETGVKWTWDGGHQWEHLRRKAPNITIQYVDDSGIFVMNDQPELLDAAIRDFASRSSR